MAREGQQCNWYITPEEAQRGIKLPPGMHFEGGQNTCPRNLPAEQAATARPDGKSLCPHADPKLCNSAYLNNVGVRKGERQLNELLEANSVLHINISRIVLL